MSREVVLEGIDDYERELDARFAGVLAAAALETGVLGDRLAVKAQVEAAMRDEAEARGEVFIPTFFDEDGHLIPVGDLDDEARAAFDQWIEDLAVNDVIGPARNDYKLIRIEEVKDR